ncbi:MAG: MarR family transcriptional regulator [Hyphomonadaceae bacterium]|jgi:DNA-binding MarR family transcriptional regulator|nr:MarR family transcriptional regulator [Hyphomonadaceae bacterium]
MANSKSAGGKAAKAPPRPVARPFRIGFLVHDVSRMRRTLFDQAVRPLGLTRSQWWVLANLSRHDSENGVMQTELAKLLDVGKVTVGGLIDRLEASGHVERKPDAVDRRAKRVLITAKGYRVIEQMSEVGNELNRTILEGISRDRVKAAEEVLHDMKDNLKRRLNGMTVDLEEDDI